MQVTSSNPIPLLLSYNINENKVSKTIHKPLSPMNLLILLIRITGKNDRQISAIKTEMILTYHDLYFTITLIPF